MKPRSVGKASRWVDKDFLSIVTKGLGLLLITGYDSEQYIVGRHCPDGTVYYCPLRTIGSQLLLTGRARTFNIDLNSPDSLTLLTIITNDNQFMSKAGPTLVLRLVTASEGEPD